MRAKLFYWDGLQISEYWKWFNEDIKIRLIENMLNITIFELFKSAILLHDDSSAELHCFKSDIIIIKLPERNNRTFFKNRKLNISNVERFSRFNQESPAMLSIYLIAIVRMIMTRQIYDKNDFSKSMISHKSKKFKSL